MKNRWPYRKRKNKDNIWLNSDNNKFLLNIFEIDRESKKTKIQKVDFENEDLQEKFDEKVAMNTFLTTDQHFIEPKQLELVEVLPSFSQLLNDVENSKNFF
jgi:hypothetical protein